MKKLLMTTRRLLVDFIEDVICEYKSNNEKQCCNFAFVKHIVYGLLKVHHSCVRRLLLSISARYKHSIDNNTRRVNIKISGSLISEKNQPADKLEKNEAYISNDEAEFKKNRFIIVETV